MAFTIGKEVYQRTNQPFGKEYKHKKGTIIAVNKKPYLTNTPQQPKKHYTIYTVKYPKTRKQYEYYPGELISANKIYTCTDCGKRIMWHHAKRCGNCSRTKRRKKTNKQIYKQKKAEDDQKWINRIKKLELPLKRDPSKYKGVAEITKYLRKKHQMDQEYYASNHYYHLIKKPINIRYIRKLLTRHNLTKPSKKGKKT